MPKYIIEREIPNAGNLSPDPLRGISRPSCSMLRNFGPEIQWMERYVTDDKVYCVYRAPCEEPIPKHASQGRFPANSIRAVQTMIDPGAA